MITEGPERWGGGVRARDAEAEGNPAGPSPPSTTAFISLFYRKSQGRTCYSRKHEFIPFLSSP